MKEIGRIIREQRIKKNLGLDEIHKDTKIQEKYLAAIEEGDMSAFLAEIYYKTFMKSYARYLGLDPEFLALQYEKNKCGSEEEERKAKEDGNTIFKIRKKQQCSDKDKKSEKEKKSADVKKLLVTVLVVVFLLVVFLYLNKNIASMTNDTGFIANNVKPVEIKSQEQGPPDTPKNSSETLSQTSPVLSSTQTDVQVGKSGTSMPAVTAAQTAAVSGAKNTEPKKPVKPAVKSEDKNNVSSSRKNADNAKNNKIVSLTSTVQTALMQVKTPEVKPERLKLSIEAIENVWIKVEADNREVFQGTVIKGDKKEWQSDEQFNLKIGYTPGVKVFFDNQPIDVVKGSVQDVNTIVLRRERQ